MEVVATEDRLLRSREISKKLGISHRTFPDYIEKLRPYGLKKKGQWVMPLSGLVRYIHER